MQYRVYITALQYCSETVEAESEDEAKQEVVRGLIQPLYPFADPVALIANDEGKLLGLPMNRGLRDEDGKLYDILCGTFFLCGISGDGFVSLTEEQIQHFKRVFAAPGLFVKFNGHLVILPLNEGSN